MMKAVGVKREEREPVRRGRGEGHGLESGTQLAPVIVVRVKIGPRARARGIVIGSEKTGGSRW